MLNLHLNVHLNVHLNLHLNVHQVSFFSGIMLYILNDNNVVPLFGAVGGGPLVNHDMFFAVYNAMTFLGDFISRKLVYYWKPRR